MNISGRTIEARRVEAQHPPAWSGDLLDDCTARWAGFILRAEEMEEGIWWYAAIDTASGAYAVDSTVSQTSASDGISARQRCEEAARAFLQNAPNS
jgi:hypothetical protein